MGRRDPDPRPPVEILGAEAPHETTRSVEIGRSGRAGRGAVKGWLAAAAVGAVLLGGLALGDGGDGGDDGDSAPTADGGEEARDGSARAPGQETTTTGRRMTTTAPPPVPILPGSGVRLVLGGARSSPVILDLETGRTTTIKLDGAHDLFSLVSVRGGVVAIDGNVARYLSFDGTSPVDLGTAQQVFPSGEPESVWVVAPQTSTIASPEAVLVGLDGTILAAPATPRAGYLAGAHSAGLIAAVGGRIYLADRSGEIHPIGIGDILGVADDHVLARTCDDRSACALTVWGPDLARSRSLEVPDEVLGAFGGSIAVHPDEGLMALVSYGPRGGMLSILDLAGGPARTDLGIGEVAAMVWLPGDLGLVVAQSNKLQRVRLDGDDVVVEKLFDDGALSIAVIPP